MPNKIIQDSFVKDTRILYSILEYSSSLEYYILF